MKPQYNDFWKIVTPCERYTFLFCRKTKVFKWITDHIPKYQKKQHEKKILENYGS
jgi:hypothetical protein